MFQKTEKEEAEFKVVPEAMNNCVNNNCVIPCVNNCGLKGNPAMNNMCQKCFTSTTSTSISTSSSPASVVASAAGAIKFGEKSPRSSSSKRSSLERTTDRAETSRDLIDGIKAEASSTLSPVVKRDVNRCSGCRRKVGLTGFRCRCGDLFCAEHRYSDRHDCSYDYKAAGREAIARENPVVKAAKIVKV